MKKFWLFSISVLIAFTIEIYSKKANNFFVSKNKNQWKTFEKNSNQEIISHKTTNIEMQEAHIPTTKRAIAQEQKPEKDLSGEDSSNVLPNSSNFLMRENRVLIGDIQKRNYQDENIELEMNNVPNNNWKEILGSELLRFQHDDTKVMVKEEFPVIKIIDGKGIYLEQVLITYMFKNGNKNSYRALVNSETGLVIETWDRTVHENYRKTEAGIALPIMNTSGITTR